MATDLLKGQGIRLYNLFPRLVGNMERWTEHLDRLVDLGFNAVWVNPFHYPGFSGSLYSPKDYYKFNPLFIDPSQSAPLDQLKEFISSCHKRGLVFIMDLVINHTAIDCTLIQEHPSWFRFHPDGKIVHPGANHNNVWVEWGDLAEIDNAHSSDRQNLWEFWWRMISTYLEVGVDGFRCDAAYQVPNDLWRFLIGRCRQKKPGCLFLAESLGCSFHQVEELAQVGFDYLFNSSKYWNYNDPWGMEQYHKTKSVVSTISFPESHDSPRMIEEMNGDLAAVKRQIVFSAYFTKGLMYPIGLEYGFRRKLDVVSTDPGWWENTGLDLTDFIKRVLTVKRNYPALNQETGLEVVNQENWYNIFCFRRTLYGQDPVFVAINKDRANHQRLFIPNLDEVLGPGTVKDISPEYMLETVPKTFEYYLRPSEVKVLTLA